MSKVDMLMCMMDRLTYEWRCRERILPLGQETRVMGILNVTPDSFSDGGRYKDPERAVVRALEMVQEGASIIDVGGESTRPGAAPVSIDEEILRVIEVIRRLRNQSKVFISIDTMHAETAQRALDAGADIINDVSALEHDGEMARVAKQSGAGVILMHMKGTPQTMQQSPDYADVVAEVGSYLAERMDAAVQQGIERERLVVDPGFGFGKTTAHNLALLKELPHLSACRAPLLIGFSRKRFLGEVLKREDPVTRRAGGLGASAWSILHGAHILRTHDVIDTCDVCRLVDILVAGDSTCS